MTFGCRANDHVQGSHICTRPTKARGTRTGLAVYKELTEETKQIAEWTYQMKTRRLARCW